jgi:RNA polymerase-binding transcription factor DksA
MHSDLFIFETPSKKRSEMTMTSEQLTKYQAKLQAMADRFDGTVRSLEEQTQVATGGQSGSDLSDAPMHLADMGTEMYQQELSSTLLENEATLRDEVIEALNRIDRGSFGTCEHCGKAIPKGRLDALPYTRYCAPCASEAQAGTPANLNEGRPQQGQVDLLRDRPGAGGKSKNRAAFVDMEDGANARDSHAEGTPGGGTAVGGLAGTNINDGSPENADLEAAMGSSNFDEESDEDRDDREGYSGRSGGAVGGTPANKRAEGGHTGGGIAP